MQLTLALKMSTAHVVETSVTVNNSSIQDHTCPENHNHNPPTYDRNN